MDDVIVKDTPVSVSVNGSNPVTVTVPSTSFTISASIGTSGPILLYGTGSPPDPTNLPNGTVYFKYTP